MKSHNARQLLTCAALACTLAIVAACSGSSSSLNPTSPSAAASAGANFSPNPDTPPPPPPDNPCSPGYWKNHEEHFAATCTQVSGWTCDELYAAIATCKGSDASCRRNEAANLLSAVPPGCSESD
jgi:hypothetical protein